jgi:hypothetical protein
MALMMEAVRTSETLANSYQSPRHYNPDDSHLQSAVVPYPQHTIPLYILTSILYCPLVYAQAYYLQDFRSELSKHFSSPFPLLTLFQRGRLSPTPRVTVRNLQFSLQCEVVRFRSKPQDVAQPLSAVRGYSICSQLQFVC